MGHTDDRRHPERLLSGIDGNHPDLRDTFNRRLSRNFVTNIPLIEGPCEHPSCVDPVDEDDDGHGTHVAGLVGIDVVNMSSFIDPLLYNCLDNPANSSEAQAERRTVRVATQRAVNFTKAHRTTPIAALGNQHTDLGNPPFDDPAPTSRRAPPTRATSTTPASPSRPGPAG